MEYSELKDIKFQYNELMKLFGSFIKNSTFDKNNILVAVHKYFPENKEFSGDEIIAGLENIYMDFTNSSADEITKVRDDKDCLHYFSAGESYIDCFDWWHFIKFFFGLIYEYKEDLKLEERANYKNFTRLKEYDKKNAARQSDIIQKKIDNILEGMNDNLEKKQFLYEFNKECHSKKLEYFWKIIGKRIIEEIVRQNETGEAEVQERVDEIVKMTGTYFGSHRFKISKLYKVKFYCLKYFVEILLLFNNNLGIKFKGCLPDLTTLIECIEENMDRTIMQKKGRKVDTGNNVDEDGGNEVNYMLIYENIKDDYIDDKEIVEDSSVDELKVLLFYEAMEAGNVCDYCYEFWEKIKKGEYVVNQENLKKYCRDYREENRRRFKKYFLLGNSEGSTDFSKFLVNYSPLLAKGWKDGNWQKFKNEFEGYIMVKFYGELDSLYQVYEKILFMYAKNRNLIGLKTSDFSNIDDINGFMDDVEDIINQEINERDNSDKFEYGKECYQHCFDWLDNIEVVKEVFAFIIEYWLRITVNAFSDKDLNKLNELVDRKDCTIDDAEFDDYIKLIFYHNTVFDISCCINKKIR